MIGILHFLDDAWTALPFREFPHFATVSLFLVPVVYAALNFGLAGSMATALWAIVLSLPDLILIDPPRDRVEDLIQLVVVLAVAVFVGQRVERETITRRDLEIARNDLRAYASRVIAAQEEERRRIAQEIHDEPLQELIQLARELDATAGLDAGGAAAARQHAVTIAGDLRRISQGLRPPGLDELGLPAAIGRMCRQLEERTKAKVSFTSAGEAKRLDPMIELSIFRIAQEALHNVEKHAAARNVSMTFVSERKGAVLELKDDGVGFASEDRAPGRLGLLGMGERAELIGGVLTVTSRVDQGTTVRLVVQLDS